ncbi:MAG TPA: hypothetical protein PLU80_11635, partial [Acidobacteriota bacterium]|nr:hypothetical protein [Acidobacteriota bacterium]
MKTPNRKPFIPEWTHGVDFVSRKKYLMGLNDLFSTYCEHCSHANNLLVLVFIQKCSVLLLPKNRVTSWIKREVTEDGKMG